MAKIELQETLEDWAVPQLFVFTEKDLDWWPLLRRVLTEEGWSLSQQLDHRLDEVFRSRRLLEEEVAWAAALELSRDSAPPPVFCPVAIVRRMVRERPRRSLRDMLAARRRLICSPGF